MKQLPRSACVLLATIFLAGSRLTGQALTPGRTFHVNGIEMWVEVRGAGEPLVLLHGFSGCGRAWRPVVDQLAEQYKLIIPDLRGHGHSTSPGGFTHRQSALDVYGLLDQLGVKNFRAMGIRTGGMTLLHMATQQRDRISAMVLIGTTSYFPDEARAFMRQVAAESLSAPIRRMYGECATRGDPPIRDLVASFGRFKDSYDDMNFTAPYLGTIKARTLIVHGDRDEFFPVNIPVAMYQAIPGSALWIVPNGGHVPIFGSHLREFVDVTLRFLRTPQ